MKRVVVTGIGIVSCLGNNQAEVYDSLLNTRSGIAFSEEYKKYNFKSQICGSPKIKVEDYIDRKIIRFMGAGSAYNYIAMKEAVIDSGLEEKDISNETIASITKQHVKELSNNNPLYIDSCWELEILFNVMIDLA